MRLIVCPSLHAGHNFKIHRPSHVLGLLSPGQDQIALPSRPDHRLELRFNDIAVHQDGLVAPDETAVRMILTFAHSWHASASMLIYCFAGISRSTAAAFMFACQLNPHIDEETIAHLLRRASPSATPNPLMIALADTILERQGRMSDAAAAIGRGEGLSDGFMFDVE